MTAARTAGVIALAALAFAAAYLLTSSGRDAVRAPSALRELSFPSPAVALRPAASGRLPSLARAPRPARRPAKRASAPSSPAPGPARTPAPAPTPTPAPAPAPAPSPAPAPAPAAPSGGGIIDG